MGVKLFYSVGFFSGFILALIIGVLVVKAGPGKFMNRIWGLLSLCVGVWFLGRFMVIYSESPGEAYIWQRVMYLGAIFLNVVYCHFIFSFLERKKTSPFLIIGYFLCLFLFVMNLFSRYLVIEMRSVDILNYYEVPGPLYYVFFSIYLIYPGVAFLFLIRERKKTQGSRRIQIDYLLLASIFGFASGLTTFPLVFGLSFPPYGAPFVSVYIFIMAFAILKYRLMDLNLIMRWGLAYGVSILVMANQSFQQTEVHY